MSCDCVVAHSCSDQCVDVCRLLTDKDLLLLLSIIRVVSGAAAVVTPSLCAAPSLRLNLLLAFVVFFFFSSYDRAQTKICVVVIYTMCTVDPMISCTQHIFMCFSDRSEKWSCYDGIKNLFIHIRFCFHQWLTLTVSWWEFAVLTNNKKHLLQRLFIHLLTNSRCLWKETNILKVSQNYQKKNQSSEFLSHDYDYFCYIYFLSLAETGFHRWWLRLTFTSGVDINNINMCDVQIRTSTLELISVSMKSTPSLNTTFVRAVCLVQTDVKWAHNVEAANLAHTLIECTLTHTGSITCHCHTLAVCYGSQGIRAGMYCLLCHMFPLRGKDSGVLLLFLLFWCIWMHRAAGEETSSLWSPLWFLISPPSW